MCAGTWGAMLSVQWVVLALTAGQAWLSPPPEWDQHSELVLLLLSAALVWAILSEPPVGTCPCS